VANTNFLPQRAQAEIPQGATKRKNTYVFNSTRGYQIIQYMQRLSFGNRLVLQGNQYKTEETITFASQ
jgi:hypothetical protein